MLHVSVIKGCECPHLHTLSTGPSPKRLPGAIDRRYPRAAGGWCSELTGRDPPTKHKSGEETNPFNPNSTLFVKAPPNSATSFSPWTLQAPSYWSDEVLHIFHHHGAPSRERAYLFNGDISDRGAEAMIPFSLCGSLNMDVSQNWDTLKISLVFEN